MLAASGSSRTECLLESPSPNINDENNLPKDESNFVARASGRTSELLAGTTRQHNELIMS